MAVYNTIDNMENVNESMFEGITGDGFIHEASFKGAMENIYENEQNYAMLMKGIGISELAHLEENGTECMYESAGSVDGFFGKLKQFFLKIYEKVKGIFKKFLATLDTFIKSDKDFANKYRSHLLQVDTGGFKYKGYVFKVDTVNINVDGGKGKVTGAFSKGSSTFDDGAAATYDTEAKGWIKDKEDHQETIRGEMCGAGGKMSSKDMTTHVAEKLRNGESSPVEIETVDVSKMLNTITGYKEGKKQAEKDFKGIEKGLKEIIKDIETKQKSISKELGKDKSPDKDKARAAFIRATSGLCDGYKFVMNVAQTIQGLKMSAMKSEYKQAKAVCVKLVNYKTKNEGAFTESGNVFNPLTGIEFR